MATITWPLWTRSHTTDEIMPLDVRGPDGQPVTSFSVAVTATGTAEPAPGAYTAAETDGTIRGPRIGTTKGHTAGTYWAWPRVNARVLPPIAFLLT